MNLKPLYSYYYSRPLYIKKRKDTEYFIYRTIIYNYPLHLQYGLCSHRYDFNFSKLSKSKYSGRRICIFRFQAFAEYRAIGSETESSVHSVPYALVFTEVL